MMARSRPGNDCGTWILSERVQSLLAVFLVAAFLFTVQLLTRPDPHAHVVVYASDHHGHWRKSGTVTVVHHPASPEATRDASPAPTEPEQDSEEEEGEEQEENGGTKGGHADVDEEDFHVDLGHGEGEERRGVAEGQAQQEAQALPTGKDKKDEKNKHRKVEAWVAGGEHAPAWISKVKSTSGAVNYNHMAMVEALPGGVLCAVWQASTEGEGKADQHLRIAYATDPLARKWSQQTVIPWSKGGGHARWSPVLQWVGPDGTPSAPVADASEGSVWLFYTESTEKCRAPGGHIRVAVMTWPGREWGEPRTLLSFEDEAPINKVIANRLTVLASGAWVLPFWRERGRSCTQVPANTKLAGMGGVLLSEDRGASWSPHGAISAPGTWMIEQTVVELSDGALLMLCRTAKDLIYQSKSKDGGRTWSEGAPMASASLPNPNAKIAAISLRQPPVPVEDGGGAAAGRGCVVLCFNDHKLMNQPYTRTRTHLKLAVSCDGKGGHWQRVLTVDSSKVPGLRHHYPTIVQLPLPPADAANGTVAGASKKHRIVVAFSSFFMKGFKKSAPEGIRSVVVDIVVPSTV